MATLINTGTQASCAAASSLSVVSPSATSGHTLVLQVSWVDTFAGGAIALSAPSGWTAALAPNSSYNGGGTACGYGVFYKTAAGGVETAVVAEPSGVHTGLYADGVITEWSGMGAYDSASSSAVLTNNSAASTTGCTVPNTGTLANANSTAFTGVALTCSTGSTNAGIAFSGGSWTTEMSDQNTSASVGALAGHQVISSTAPLNAVYTWTSDASMSNFQAAVVVFSDSGSPAASYSLTSSMEF